VSQISNISKSKAKSIEHPPSRLFAKAEVPKARPPKCAINFIVMNMRAHHGLRKPSKEINSIVIETYLGQNVWVPDEDQKLLCASSCHVEPLRIRQEAEVVLVVELDKFVAERDKEEHVAVSRGC
jgi:hypothetical protein